MVSKNHTESEEFTITQQLIEKYYRNILGYSLDERRKRTRELSESDSIQQDNFVKQYFRKVRSFLYYIVLGDYEKNLLIQKITSQKKHAMSYDEWKLSSVRLDDLTDKNSWKEIDNSSYYDYSRIRDLTDAMRKERLNKNYPQLLYLIRTNWVRNLGNMGNVNLYRYTHTGTKYLIDEYMTESNLCLETLLNQSDLDNRYLLEMLQQTRRNIGRTALVLSGGGTFGLFHIGVLSTLFELDLLPRVISGSSAGAIVASILSVCSRDELPALFERILNTDFNIFKDDKLKSESENLLIKISRFFKNGTWFDNKHLERTMKEFLGELTFREAYNRTGKILNITVSPASLFEQPRLLNNLTAPNVLIWSAVCASCSLPGIFPSSPLFEKDQRTGELKQWNGTSSVKFVDGSVDNDLPIARLSEMFNIDHIIACQVNIHVVPILKLSLTCVGGDIQDEFSAKIKQWLTTVYNFMANEAMHILEMGCEMGLAKNVFTKLRSVLSQQYSGDITILPDLAMFYRINELLSNPSKEFLLREITNGARATWPKVSIIQNHCGQEFALEKAISFLKGKILMSSSIKNPLQFSNVPMGLVKYTTRTDEGDHNALNMDKDSKILDDNLVETEMSNSFLLLQNNKNAQRRFSSFKIAPTTANLKIQRRNSDSIYQPKFSFELLTPTLEKDSSDVTNSFFDSPFLSQYHSHPDHRKNPEHHHKSKDIRSTSRAENNYSSKIRTPPNSKKINSQYIKHTPNVDLMEKRGITNVSPKNMRDKRCKNKNDSTNSYSNRRTFYTESDTDDISRNSTETDLNTQSTKFENSLPKRSMMKRRTMRHNSSNTVPTAKDIERLSDGKIEYLGEVSPERNYTYAYQRNFERV